MRRGVLSVAVLLICGLAFSAAAKESWTGWISDSNCAAKGTNADHKACLQKCVKEKGAKYVFVDSKTKAVYAIHNQDAVKEADLGHEVVVIGDKQADKSIHVIQVQSPKAKT